MLQFFTFPVYRLASFVNNMLKPGNMHVKKEILHNRLGYRPSQLYENSVYRAKIIRFFQKLTLSFVTSIRIVFSSCSLRCVDTFYTHNYGKYYEFHFSSFWLLVSIFSLFGYCLDFYLVGAWKSSCYSRRRGVGGWNDLRWKMLRSQCRKEWYLKWSYSLRPTGNKGFFRLVSHLVFKRKYNLIYSEITW